MADTKHKPPGFTAYLVVGAYAGWAIKRSEFGVRIILGWVAIGLMTLDMEQMIGKAASLLPAREVSNG